MNKTTRSFMNFFLGLLTCVLVVSPSIASGWSRDVVVPVVTEATQVGQTASPESILAGGMAGQSMKRYTVSLSSSGVVPKAPTTAATGIAEATLKGDRLMVKGRFSTLSSGLRDYTTDPTDPPNPKITSAVHIHRGEPTENGPFQFALNVMMNEMGMSGQFNGDYTLSSEQLQALMAGKLYIDLHTKQNRVGELRGYFRPA